MDLDLDALKTEILHFLDAAELAVFRHHPGDLDALPTILWDTERFPDYRQFLDTARKMKAELILFADREFVASEIEEEMEELEECTIDRDERREYERRLREFRKYAGTICTLELAFDHNSRLYLYEVRPDWYTSFIDLSEEIATQVHAAGEDDGGSGMSGFYSNN